MPASHLWEKFSPDAWRRVPSLLRPAWAVQKPQISDQPRFTAACRRVGTCCGFGRGMACLMLGGRCGRRCVARIQALRVVDAFHVQAPVQASRFLQRTPCGRRRSAFRRGPPPIFIHCVHPRASQRRRPALRRGPPPGPPGGILRRTGRRPPDGPRILLKETFRPVRATAGAARALRAGASIHVLSINRERLAPAACRS
jgi:hypothetical protein